MVIERVYTVPLRKGFHETAKYKKTKKAGATLVAFLSQHLKQPETKKIFIGKNLNKKLWEHGIRNPPARIKITVIKEDDGTVKAELYGFKYDHKKKEAKEEKSKVEEKLDALKGKSAEKKEKKTDTSENAEDTKAKSTSSDVKKEHHEHDHGPAKEHEHKHDAEHAHPHEMPKKAPSKKK